MNWLLQKEGRGLAMILADYHSCFGKFIKGLQVLYGIISVLMMMCMYQKCIIFNSTFRGLHINAI